MTRASLKAEQIGIPSVTVVSSAFRKQAEIVSKGLGFNAAIAEYPGVINSDTREVFKEKSRTHIVGQILESLGSEARPVARIKEPDPRDTVFSGDLDAVQEHFHNRLWSDGLAIIPPTVERVEAFLKHTRRDPNEIIGRYPPDYREATIWNIAVNGVMAGCHPRYMPILIAAVEALFDPDYRLQDAGSTPGWEPLIIVSGPIVRELHFNVETGAMRGGRRANSSIGRFLRLYARNVGGLRPTPEGGDKGTIAMNFNVALAENEAAARAVGWPTFATERGFGDQDNVVTVQSTVGTSTAIYTYGDTAEDHLELLAEGVGFACKYYIFTGVMFGAWHPLVIITPAIAQVLADGGWTKPKIREYLHQNVRTEARKIERYAYRTANDLQALVKAGLAPKIFAESTDPNRLVPVLPWKEQIGIIIAGDPGRNQARCIVQNHEQGIPISRKVESAK